MCITTQFPKRELDGNRDRSYYSNSRQRYELGQAILRGLDLIRKHPGCISARAERCIEKPGQYMLINIWTSWKSIQTPFGEVLFLRSGATIFTGYSSVARMCFTMETIPEWGQTDCLVITSSPFAIAS